MSDATNAGRIHLPVEQKAAPTIMAIRSRYLTSGGTPMFAALQSSLRLSSHEFSNSGNGRGFVMLFENTAPGPETTRTGTNSHTLRRMARAVDRKKSTRNSLG